MDKDLYEWHDFDYDNIPQGAVWDIIILHNNIKKTIKKVYFVGNKVISWYNNFKDFNTKYPNNKILQIRLSKG